MAAVEVETVVNTDTGDVIGYAGDYSIQKLRLPHSIEREWKALQSANTACIYQNYDWVRIACDTYEKNSSIHIITARDKNGLQLILPMAVEGGWVKTIRWIGSAHANICSGLYSESFLQSSNKNLMRKILKIVSKSIGGIVLSKLVNQPKTLKSYPNPMASLPQQISINKMYDMDLRDGLDAILDEGNGKRKRKLWRKQNRIVDSMGGYELVIPNTEESMIEALDEFIIMKTQRLKELGVREVFSDQNTIDFFYSLAKEPPLKEGRLFQIFQLKIAGKTRAMYALGMNAKYCQAYVNAVAYDEFSEHSPGEMILYAMISHLINEGYEKLDLGVGEERYKRSWCPNINELFNTTLPLSTSAIPFSYGLRFMNSVKRYLRNNPNLWLKLKKLRKAKAQILSDK